MKNRIWLGAAFLIGMLAVGIPYWQIPYSNVSLPNAVMGPGLLIVVVAAVLVRAVGRCRFAPTLLSTGAAVPAAVMARVVFDAMLDPTSHNLWPFELIIAGFVGLTAASGGALVGSIPGVVSRWSARRSA